MLPAALITLGKVIGGPIVDKLVESFIDKGKEATEKVIKDVTGIEIDLNKDPNKEQIQAIKSKKSELETQLDMLKAEYEHKENMMKLSNEEREIINQDIQDARNMAREFSQSDDPVIRRFVPVYTTGISLAILMFLVMIVLVDFPEQKNALVNGIVSALTNILIAMAGFVAGYQIRNQRNKEEEL